MIDLYVFQERAKKALNKTGWSGVEGAMDWLLNHPEGIFLQFYICMHQPTFK